jgi:hypothetical protein
MDSEALADPEPDSMDSSMEGEEDMEDSDEAAAEEEAGSSAAPPQAVSPRAVTANSPSMVLRIVVFMMTTP